MPFLEPTDPGFTGPIVAVATLGARMFGCDSVAIDGFECEEAEGQPS